MPSIVLIVAVPVAVVALTIFFAPWTLWTRSALDEEIPGPVGSRSMAVPEGAAHPSPVELSRGDFVRQEHKVQGVARLLLLDDGQRIVRLERFSTSDGPDLHVLLSEKKAGGNWLKYSRGHSVRLGALKATDGNHNYVIPASADLSGVASVVIWCRRFHTAFGSAPLTP